MTKLKSKLTGGTVFSTFVLMLLLVASLFAGRLKVSRIELEGNEHFSSSTLKALLKCQEKKTFNIKLMKLDRVILTNYYSRQGFLDVWVEANYQRHGDKVKIIFQIKEGIQYRLGGIQFRGASLLTGQQLRHFIPLKDGAPFLQSAIEEGLNRIERYYLDHGKPYVIIQSEQQRVDSLVFVRVNIQENESVYIRDIAYRGLEHVKIFIIRRELEIHKGDLYSRKKIEKSQRNIYSTGLFDYVGMELEPLDSARTRVRLVINVVEKKPRWVGARFGVAYQQKTIYGGTFDVTLEFGHRNLFGTARAIAVSAIPSFSYDFNRHDFINPQNQFTLTYVEPWIGYTRTPGVFQLSYYQVRPVNAADFDYLSSSFKVRHQFSEYWQVVSGLTFSKATILEPADTLDEAFYRQTSGQDLIYALDADIIHDKRDNYLAPQDGYTFEVKSKVVYSRSRDRTTNRITTNRFLKLVTQWTRYQAFPLKKSWVLATRIKGGSIVEFGSRQQIPLLERFFLGGASSVRGYPEMLLGPTTRDASGKPVAVGGKLMVLGNVELRIPLFWLFWGEVFLDAGNVWAENSYFRVTDIKPSAGGGIALVTPLGPVRFDYGVKLLPQAGESRSEFHLGISFAF